MEIIRSCGYTCIFALLIGLLGARAFAQVDPLSGRDRYPEFRNLSGLGGGGYGVDAEGRLSLSGPTALSTPVAYVLGHGHFWILGEKTSLHSDPEISNSLTNGTFCLEFGQTLGSFNIAVSDMVLSGFGNQAINLQVGLIPSRDSRFACSIGVQDIRGGGGSSGNGFPGDNRTSTSAFGVVTYHAASAGMPLYVSAGIGTRRFNQGFLSASCQVIRPLRVWAEHDGFGINFGGLLSWNLSAFHRPEQVGIRFGLIQRRYYTVGLGLGF